MSRTASKALRDLLVIAVAAAMLAFAENVADYGVPVEFAPMVSVVALTLYRFIRDSMQGVPA